MENQELLKKGLSELGINISADIVNKFLHYLSELIKWNRAYNLTAVTNESDIIIKHFFDSLLFLKAFPEGDGNICDIGSGAGFPGVPIAIVKPDVLVTLIEPSRKKCAFLKNVKRVLSLEKVQVVESRVESVREAAFDIATTRALFDIREFLKKTEHLVKKGGCFIVSKGPKYREELENIPSHARFFHVAATLPLTSLQRHLIRVIIN